MSVSMDKDLDRDMDVDVDTGRSCCLSSPPTMADKRCPHPYVPVHVGVHGNRHGQGHMDVDVDTGRFLQLNIRRFII